MHISEKRTAVLESKKLRFAAVGVVNTAVDFTVLFLLTKFFGLPTAVANIGSTSAGLGVSYTLNKKAVFKNTDTHNYKQILLFVSITLFGLWVVQGFVIAGVLSLLSPIKLNDTLSLFFAKIVATLFSLVWNYLWYSKVVFKKENV